MPIRSRISAIQESMDSYGRVLFYKNSFMIFGTRLLAVIIFISYIVILTILEANKFVSFAYKVRLTRGQSRWTCGVITFAMEQVSLQSGQRAE